MGMCGGGGGGAPRSAVKFRNCHRSDPGSIPLHVLKIYKS